MRFGHQTYFGSFKNNWSLVKSWAIIEEYETSAPLTYLGKWKWKWDPGGTTKGPKKIITCKFPVIFDNKKTWV